MLPFGSVKSYDMLLPGKESAHQEKRSVIYKLIKPTFRPVIRNGKPSFDQLRSIVALEEMILTPIEG